MKTFILLLIGFTCLLSQHRSNQYLTSKQKIIKNLKKLENSYISTLNFEERRKAIRIMNRILEELDYTTDLGKKDRRRHPRNVMSDEVFASFLKQLKNESSFTKQDLVKETIKFGMISANQASLIIEQFHSSFDKLDVFKICFPKIYDKVNVSLTLNSLPYSFKSDALKFLKQYEQQNKHSKTD